MSAVVSKYSTWLKALQSNPNDKLRYDYVRLLIIGLDHHIQVYPFTEFPPDAIEPIEVDDWPTKAKTIFFNSVALQPAVPNPPVMTAVSEDKRQFAAYQTIPSVGMQCYYAQSDDPLYDWSFKSNSISVAPAKPLHAIPLDWERSLAGIRRTNVDSRYLDSPATLNQWFYTFSPIAPAPSPTIFLFSSVTPSKN